MSIRRKGKTAVQALLGPDYLDPAAMWQNAARQAQADVDADPQNAYAWFNLGTNLTQLGQLTGGAEYYENAAAAFDQARLIGLPRRMLWYQFQPYVAYLRVGRYQDVLTLASATEISEGGRNVEETAFYRGLAYLALGDETQADGAFREALQLNPHFALAQQALDR